MPERERQSTWKEFLEAHWDVLGAIDFTTIEVWTKSGLITFHLLFVMEVGSRRVHFAGSTAMRSTPSMPTLSSEILGWGTLEAAGPCLRPA